MSVIQAAVLAEMGHKVICVDVDADKVAARKRDTSLFEPGLAPLVLRNHQAGSPDLHHRPGTGGGVCRAYLHRGRNAAGRGRIRRPPSGDDGGGHHRPPPDGKVVVNKTTVPVGTASRVRRHIAERLADRGLDLPLDVVSNPNFKRGRRRRRPPAAGSHHHRHRPDHAFSLLESSTPSSTAARPHPPDDARSAELTK